MSSGSLSGRRGSQDAPEEDVVVGRHVFGNLYGVSSTTLWDREFLERLVREAARRAKMRLVDLKSWEFGGRHGGVSIIALVLESHIAIHTWPEHGYATVDVYTCGGSSDPFEAFKYIVSELKPKRVVAYYADRSSKPQPIDLERVREFLKPITILGGEDTRA